MKKTSLFKSSVDFALSSYVFQFINFGMTLILARLLSPEFFGVFAMMVVAKEIFSALLGFSSPQYFILSEGKKSDFALSFSLSLLSAGALFLLGIVAVFYLQFRGPSGVALPLLALCLAQGIDNVAAILLAPIERKTDYLKLSLIRNSCSTISLGIAALSALIWPSIWSLVMREVLIAVFLLVFGVKYSVIPLSVELEKRAVFKAVRFAYQLTLSRVSEILFYRAPDIVISQFFGLSQTGHFFQSRNFLMLVLKVPNTILDQTLFSTFVRLEREKKGLSSYIFLMELILSRVMSLAALGLCLFGPLVFNFLYGEKWLLASSLIPKLSWFVFFAALFNFAQAYCYSKGSQTLVFFSYLIGTATFIMTAMYAVALSDLSIIAWGLTFSMGAACIIIHILGNMFSTPFDLVKIFWLPFLSLLSIWRPWNLGSLSPEYTMLLFVLCIVLLSAYEIRAGVRKVGRKIV